MDLTGPSTSKCFIPSGGQERRGEEGRINIPASSCNSDWGQQSDRASDDEEEDTAPKVPAKADTKKSSEPAAGFKRMEIVEASDDESDKENSKDPLEPYPDIKLASSRQGIEEAKSQANRLFSDGKLDESIRWFSKGI